LNTGILTTLFKIFKLGTNKDVLYYAKGKTVVHPDNGILFRD
jgi:hypothetical protein